MAAIGAAGPDRRSRAARDRLIVASIERRVQSGPNGKQYGVTYRVRYRGSDGRERSKSFKLLRDAKRWASTQTASIAKGEWVDPHQSRITFADWVPQWEHTLHHLRPRTRQLNVGVVHNYLLPRFGPKPLDTISRSDVRTMLDPPWVSRRLGSLDSNQWLVGVGGSVGGLEVVG